jgi:hypothetical protein
MMSVSTEFAVRWKGAVVDVSLSELYGAFDMDGEEAVRRLARRAEAECGLGVTVISAAAREGFTLGAASAELVARHLRRTATYTELVRVIQQALPEPRKVRVLKGSVLATQFWTELVRPAGDLDLVAADEQSFWIAAQTVRSVHNATPFTLTRFRSADRTDFVMGLEWPSPDPLLESDYEVELSTVAYVGDGALLPIRRECPDVESLTQMLALAEESVQRPPSVKDALDVVALLRAFTDLAVDRTAEAVRDYRLGPELEDLLRTAAGAFPSAFVDPRAQTIVAAVGDLAVAERRRRPARPERSSVDITNWPGDIAFGVYLDAGDGLDHSALLTVTTHCRPGCDVLCTPVGDFLLTNGREIEEAAWTAAPHLLAEMHRAVEDVAS